MATDRTGYIDVADVNSVIFTDSKKDDFIIYTEASNQNILFGTLLSNVSAMAIRSNNVHITNRLNIGGGSNTPAVSLEVNTTDSLLLPKGTTGQRPQAPMQGYVRYNTDINTFEGFGAGNAWGSLGGVKDTNQDTYISAESYPTSNDDNLVFFNSNIEMMRLTKQGYLGIGKSNPQYRLDVLGSLNASSLLVGGLPLSANAGGGFTSSSNNSAYTFCNISIGSSAQTSYPLNVTGDMNFTGRLLQNGYEIMAGMSQTSMVTSFQLVPVSGTWAISSQTATQSVFNLVCDGTVTTVPSRVQVMLNGTKLVYLNDLNKDFTLSISNPTPYTTQFTISLMYPASYGDVVDIIVWPFIPDYKGVYLTNTDFSSNITFSNVGIGISNPSYPLHLYNSGTNSWATGIQNGKVTTLISHSNGGGIKIYGSNISSASTTAAIECINGSNMLFYLRNDGVLGIGKSNVSNTYALDVQGAINASGSVTSASDIRLKTDVVKIEDALDKVKNLSGYSFYYKNNIEKRQLGLIAQEVESVLPEAVFKDDDGYMSVAYGNIVAVLIEAIKSQQVQIDDLRCHFGIRDTKASNILPELRTLRGLKELEELMSL